jgi:acylpyruvate hydrolase
MRIVTFRADGSPWRAGFEHGGMITELQTLPSLRSNPSLSVKQLLALGADAVSTALTEAEDVITARGDGVSALDEAELGPPILDPDKILCIGLNYREHAAESGLEVPEAPTVFAKFRNSLIGHGAPILLPRISQEVDYEGELAVVIGSRCKDIDEEHALEQIAGYTVFNDVSARDVQMQTSQWTAGKALDSFAPIGPGIVPSSLIDDPQTLTVTTRVNNEVRQHESTSMMIFSVAKTIAFISSVMTLEPGDIIATGTPAGVGFKRDPPIYLIEGDIVEVEVEDVGLLQNPVIAG